MNIIGLHKIASVLTGIYLLLWACLFYMVNTSLRSDPRCITGLVILISLFYMLTVLYLAGFIIAYFISPKPARKHYWWFVAVVVMPPLAGGIWFGVL